MTRKRANFIASLIGVAMIALGIWVVEAKDNTIGFVTIIMGCYCAGSQLFPSKKQI